MSNNDIFSQQQTFGCIPIELAKTLSGIEIFKQMLSGDIASPAINKTMNFNMIEAEEGRTLFHGIPKEDHYNPIGSIHGGWAATILDAALASCIHSKLPAGSGFTTIEFKVNLVRPLTHDIGRVLCEGNVLHFGRTIATSEARLTTETGKLLAHGIETCAILGLK